MPDYDFEQSLQRARALAAGGEALQAEMLLLRLLEREPSRREVLTGLAQLAQARDDHDRARAFLLRARALEPADLSLALDHAQMLWRADDLRGGQEVIEQALAAAPRGHPDLHTAWLVLGELRRQRGEPERAARAWHQALLRARARSQWQRAEDTPPALRAAVAHAREAVREARRAHLNEALAGLRAASGGAALERIDLAIEGWIADPPRMPADERQKPKFLYVPDLPSVPYLDPYQVPWASQLAKAFPLIRNEAIELFTSGEPIASFYDFQSGDRVEEYLGGASANPTWNAFFFYRHGNRYDRNHERCPGTSEILESFDLFRIPGQSPEICFSFLAPQTTIQPHHGVSNTRLVMHLPLLVPRDCALNLVGVGEHRWREGELLLFDDTYLHEAWNRSDEMRIVLLMDCWNPALTEIERRAVAAVIEASSEFDRAL